MRGTTQVELTCRPGDREEGGEKTRSEMVLRGEGERRARLTAMANSKLLLEAVKLCTTASSYVPPHWSPPFLRPNHHTPKNVPDHMSTK